MVEGQVILRPQNTLKYKMRLSKRVHSVAAESESEFSQSDNEACRCSEVLLLSKVILHTLVKGA